MQGEPSGTSCGEEFQMPLMVVDLAAGKGAALASRLLTDLGYGVVRPDILQPESSNSAETVWRRDTLWAKEGGLAAHLGRADICIVGGEGRPDFRWGSAASLSARYPSLVVVDLTGYGDADPMGKHPASDLLTQARTGLVWEHDATRPILLGSSLPTYGMAIQAVVGALVALIERADSGRGQIVTASLLQGIAMYWSQMWMSAERTSVGFDRVAPRGVRPLIFPCKDGLYIQFAMGVPGSLAKLYGTLGIAIAVDPADRGAPDPSRGANYFGDIDLIASHVLEFDRADLLQSLWTQGFAAEAVLAPGEVWNEPQTAANDLIGEAEVLGRYVRCPIRWTATSNVRTLTGKGAIEARRGPLAGIRIVDFGAVVAGPFASALLADLGADVIKVEPLSGDFNRRQTRTAVAANRRKRSIAIDAKHPEGAVLVARLCRSANAVHHNFRVGVAERLGLDPASVRKQRADIVTLETSAYGAQGPKARMPGFDSLMQAQCGHEIKGGGVGNLPHCNRSFFVDFTAGALGGVALAHGLLRQRIAGQGGDAATSLLAAGTFLLSEIIETPSGEMVGTAPLNADQTGFTPYQCLYQAQEGWIAIDLVSDSMANRLADILGIELPPQRFDWGESDRKAIQVAVRQWVVGELLMDCEANDVWAEPCIEGGWKDLVITAAEQGRSLTATVSEDEHGQVTGWLAPFFALSRSNPELSDGHSPGLGEHSDAVLLELGCSEAEIASFRANKVIA